MIDYIETPKPNGYQSLHMTVIPFLYESMFRLEVQIGWLNTIRERQEEFVGNMSSREFVDTITRDLLGSRVFVFMPRGEIKNLPKGATVINYAYMIHTEIGNKMVAAKALSSKSAFQRHKQWLKHAKTRSARHKIMKFLKEQAPLSASELTTDSISEFIADSDDDDCVEEVSDYSKGSKFTWEKILRNVMKLSSSKLSEEDVFKIENGSVKVPKLNGNHMQHVSLKAKGELLSQGNGVAEMILANISMYKEVLPGLEN